MTEFQILNCLPFRLKKLHYVGDFGNPQHNDKKKLFNAVHLFSEPVDSQLDSCH